MRRALASFLLAVFSLPLIAALAFATPSSTLPACCRRNGKHHCDMASPDGSGAPAFTAVQPKCPLFPRASAGPADSKIPVPTADARAAAPHPIHSAPVAEAAPHASVASRGSIHKRGPPTQL